MVVGRPGREEPTPVVVGVEEDRGARRCGAAAEAIGRRAVGAGIFIAVGWVVGVGLAVGEVAGEFRGLEEGLFIAERI